MGTKRVFHSLNMEFCAILSVSGGGSLRLKYSGQWVLKVKSLCLTNVLKGLLIRTFQFKYLVVYLVKYLL